MEKVHCDCHRSSQLLRSQRLDRHCTPRAASQPVEFELATSMVHRRRGGRTSNSLAPQTACVFFCRHLSKMDCFHDAANGASKNKQEERRNSKLRRTVGGKQN